MLTIKKGNEALTDKNMEMLINEVHSVVDLLYDFYLYMGNKRPMHTLQLKKDIRSFISTIKVDDVMNLSNVKKKFLTNDKDIPIELHEIDLMNEFKKQKIPDGLSDCYIKYILLFMDALKKFLEREKIVSYKVIECQNNKEI